MVHDDHPLDETARQCEYDKQGMDPAKYLRVKRRRLISRLPADARLRHRVERNGRLLPILDGPPDIPTKACTEDPIQTGTPDSPGEALTEDGLKSLQSRCRSDPHCPINYLQRSQLVSMWNADNVSEDQWREHDEAEPIMRVLKWDFAIPESSFHSDEVVGQKRKRIVSAGYRRPPGRRLWPDTAAELEGEEEEELEEAVRSIETPDALNARLLRENVALRSWSPGSAPSDTPPSPPSSDESGDSGDSSDSGDDDEAAWALRIQALKEWVAESDGSSSESSRPSVNTALDPALQGMTSSVKILEALVEDDKYG